MRFVKNFTLPDFQAKNFTPSISPNFNSFSDKNTKKMSENGEIYTAGKNFTLPPALTAWTNSTSEARHSHLSLGRALLKLICLIQVCTVCSTYLYLLCIRTYSLEVCTVCSVYSPGMQSILARYAGVKSASSLVLHRGAINT